MATHKETKAIEVSGEKILDCEKIELPLALSHSSFFI